MATHTYITAAEANYYYNNDASFSAGQKTNALATSFGLVNAYLNSAVSVPVIGDWDGVSTIEAPQILKVAQGRFYQWVLETGNVGFLPELKELYDSTVEMVRGITQNEVSIPETMVFEKEAGWHIVSITRGTGFETSGGVWVRGAPPAYRSHYKLVCEYSGGGDRTGGYVDDGDFMFSAYRGDSATARVTDQAPSYEWQSVDSAFEVRWDGQWGDGCEVYVIGIPLTEVNQKTPQKNDLKQALLRY